MKVLLKIFWQPGGVVDQALAVLGTDEGVAHVDPLIALRNLMACRGAGAG